MGIEYKQLPIDISEKFGKSVKQNKIKTEPPRKSFLKERENVCR